MTGVPLIVAVVWLVSELAARLTTVVDRDGQKYGGVPPLAVQVFVYGTPTSAGPFRLVQEIETAGFTVPAKVGEEAETCLESVTLSEYE